MVELFKRNKLTLVKFYLGYSDKRAEFLNKLNFAMLHFRVIDSHLCKLQNVCNGDLYKAVIIDNLYTSSLVTGVYLNLKKCVTDQRTIKRVGPII